MRGEKGFALVLALVVTALMVAVVAEMIHQVYVDISLSRGFRDGQQASLLAESGIIGGQKLLQLEIGNRNYSALSDKWATPIKLDNETGTLEISIVDESGKINLNGLVSDNGQFNEFTEKAVKRLGKKLQIPDSAWNNLAAWLNKSKQPSPYGGVSTPYYRTQKPPYDAREGALGTAAELSLVAGFTPEIIAKLRPFVAVYPVKIGDILNINTAPKEVLMALDERIDDLKAERILEERKLKPFTEERGNGLSRVDDYISTKLAGKVSFKGNIFRITSVAKVKDTYRTVEAVVRLSGGTLSWQEY